MGELPAHDGRTWSPVQAGLIERTVAATLRPVADLLDLGADGVAAVATVAASAVISTLDPPHRFRTVPAGERTRTEPNL
jgi:hypothetical protein